MKLTRKIFTLLLAATSIASCKEYIPVETFTEPEDPTPPYRRSIGCLGKSR